MIRVPLNTSRSRILFNYLAKGTETNLCRFNSFTRNMTMNKANQSQNDKLFSHRIQSNSSTPTNARSRRTFSSKINVLDFDEQTSYDSKHEDSALSCTEKLRKMSKAFGRNPEFNFLMYNDENVLNSLAIKQRILKFNVEWDIKMDGNVARCSYKVNVPLRKEFQGETTSTNKKSAKKEAAREILSKLGDPTFEELEENTKWMVSAHKNAIKAKDEVVDRGFGEQGYTCKIEWKVEEGVFLGTGQGNTTKEAELYANQDLYVQTHKLKKDQAESNSVERNKRKAGEVEFEELTKSDASQMNSLRNSVSSKMKVNQEEKVIPCPGGFQCTLTWVWKDSQGNVNKKTVCKHGSSKVLARASASKAMLVEVGTIQDVTPEESRFANKIRSQITNNLVKSVEMSCELMERSNCSVWRLFLTQVWNEVLQKREKILAQNLINKIVEVQKNGDNHLPTDIWEKMLHAMIYVMDEEFSRKLFNMVRSLELDKYNFYSEKAKEYYQNNSILLCMECQSCIFNEIALRRDMDHLYFNQMLKMNVVRVQAPNISMTTEITQDYLKNVTTKEDDVVLVLPLNSSENLTKSSWDKGLICSVNKHKTEGLRLNLGVKMESKINFSQTKSDQMDNREYLLFNRFHTGIFNRNHNLENNRKEQETEEVEDVFTCKVFGVFHIQPMITHLRMMEALQSLTHSIYPINSNASKYEFTYEMKEILLHCKKYHELPPITMLPTTMSLTPSQNMACLSAIKNPVTLIQGPPGTGKTHVACAIIDSWNRLDPNERILAVADSNVAADNLIEGLAKKEISALRIGASSESDLQEEAIKGLYRYNTYVQLRMNGLHKEANSLRVLLFTEAIKKHKIIIATCVGSGNEILTSHTFPYVIIDECAQSIETSNLIPIGRGCKSLVLIGDHKQLRPTIISTQASKLGLNKSLLERLIEEEVAPVHLLDVQRRMHPSIAEFPNLHFYDGLLRNQDVNDRNRPQIRGLKWPVEGSNLIFVDVSKGTPNTKFETSQGTSKFNTMEVICVMAILKSFLKAGDVKENQIGILTPYDAQKGIIRKNVNLMKEYQTYNIEIDSVDGFQGKEKDLVIFSSVRSNLTKDIGFLKDPRRMNVMLTRARRGLVVLGDIFTLMNDTQNWRPFINWIYSKQLSIHVSQLNDYLEFKDETLPRSSEDLKYEERRGFQSDSTKSVRDQYQTY